MDKLIEQMTQEELLKRGEDLNRQSLADILRIEASEVTQEQLRMFDRLVASRRAS